MPLTFGPKHTHAPYSEMSVPNTSLTEPGMDKLLRQIPCESERSDDELTVPFSDCALVCDSGRRFPSSRAVLALRSKVLNSMLTSCGDRSNDTACLDVPLIGDSEEDVEIFWRYLYYKSELWNPAFLSSDRSAQLGTVKAITRLAKMADKYDCSEIMEEIQSFFMRMGVLEAAIGWTSPNRRVDSTTTYGLWCLAAQFDLGELRIALEPFLPGGRRAPVNNPLPDFNAPLYPLPSVGDQVLNRLFALLVERTAR
eukprot:jgi/Botrbrau1/17911/Bobra.50_1s0012.1